jgi:hypothetical protein
MTFEAKWLHHKAVTLYIHKSLHFKNVAAIRFMWANHQKNTYKLHVPLFPYSKNDIHVDLLSFFFIMMIFLVQRVNLSMRIFFNICK